MSPKRLFAILVAACLIVTSLFAGGFQINEHGARATGQGGAFVARASDPSAIFFNAAGLGFQKGINASVGTTLIFPSTEFTGPTPATTNTKMVSQVFYPPTLYGTYSVNDKLVVGLGVFSPYGLGTEWPVDWVGRKSSIKTDLQSFYITPSVAYKVNDQISVGVGASYVIANVTLKYRVPTMSSLGVYSTKDGTAELVANGTAFTFNGGVIYKPMPNLSIGASYRHLAEVKLKGTAKFTDMQFFAPYFPGGDGETTLPFPSNFQAGVAYTINPKLTVEADVQYVMWNTYDMLAVTLTNGPAAPLAPGGVILQKSPAPANKDWSDAMMIRLGGEYLVNDKITVRAGFIHDATPQPDYTVEPMMPDADKNDISLGAGYKINEKMSVDVAYLLVLFGDRTVKTSTNYKDNNPFPGTYKSSVHLFGLSFNYTF
jgi:long-chain fatty acid transport protein